MKATYLNSILLEFTEMIDYLSIEERYTCHAMSYRSYVIMPHKVRFPFCKLGTEHVNNCNKATLGG
jgi:hypothetical protein